MSRAVEQDRSSGEREQWDEADGDQASKSEHLELISNWNCFALFLSDPQLFFCAAFHSFDLVEWVAMWLLI